MLNNSSLNGENINLIITSRKCVPRVQFKYPNQHWWWSRFWAGVLINLHVCYMYVQQESILSNKKPRTSILSGTICQLDSDFVSHVTSTKPYPLTHWGILIYNWVNTGQVMAWCCQACRLMNQCWFMIDEAQSHLPRGISTQKGRWKYQSPRGQWVQSSVLDDV